MASGNSWQMFQELGSREGTPTTEVFERKGSKGLHRKRAKSFSHRDIKATLSERWQRHAISFRVAKTVGQKWLNKAKRFLDDASIEFDVGTSSSASNKEFATATEYSDDDEDASSSFYDAETDFKNKHHLTVKRLMTQRHSVPAFGIDPQCPIHGIKITQRRMTYHLQTPFGIYTCDDGTLYGSNLTLMPGESPVTKSELAAKLARKRKRASMAPTTREKVTHQKCEIHRNLVTLSVAFLFLASAFQGMQNIQASINSQQGLGAISLTCVYVGLVISCLFSPPYLLNRLGCKLTLIVCMSMYSLYMLINFIPKWYSLIPGSIVLGFAAAPLWAAKCTYLTEIGIRYAELNFESPNVVIVRFFGIFFLIVHLGQVFGNLISSYLLGIGLPNESMEFVDAVETTCGHFYSPTNNLSSEATNRLARPQLRAMYSLFGVYFCCTLAAIMIVATFLSQLRKDLLLPKEKPRFKLDMWHQTVQHLRKPRHLLLIPLTIFNGMEQAFIAGEFTKAYVGCCLGINHIGFVMTCLGVCDAACSLFFGPLIKLFGRMPLFMFGAVVDMLMIFTLLIWPPNAADTALFYVVAAAWGMADAVWNTQINGLWVVLFAQNLEVAFANYRLWESVGFILGFTTSPFVSIESKLYALLTILVIGMFGYGLIEMWQPLEDYSKRLKRKMYHLQPILIKKKSRHDNIPLTTVSEYTERSVRPSLDHSSEHVTLIG